MLHKNFSNKFLPVLLGVAALGMASTASANLLVNPGFETPAIATPDDPGASGWTDFSGAFTTSEAVAPGIHGPAGAHSGVQAMKVFGDPGGLHQTFAATPGQTWDGGAYVNNNSLDPMSGGRIAAVNIEWLDAGSTTFSFISNGLSNATQPTDAWVLRTISGVAPAGTAFARLTLITGCFAGPCAGAVWYDDAFMDIRPIPVPAAVWLFGSGLIGLIGIARRRKS